MLGFKFIGAALLVVSGWQCGRMLCAREKARRDQVGKTVDLLQYIRSQINIYLQPINKILRFCDASRLASCGLRDDDISADNIESKCGNMIDEMARQAVIEYFGLAGRGDRAAELGLCDRYISALTARHRALSDEYPRRCRLIMTLCLCGTSGLALLLF